MAERRKVPALRVEQWLPEWDDVPFDEAEFRRRPDPFFYVFSLPATELKRLTGVHKREAETGVPRSEELSTQRLHQPKRSREIAEFVRFGFPWSELSARQREETYPDLRKPGWLPTTVLLNVLGEDDARDQRTVHPDDLVRISNGSGPIAELDIPAVGGDWEPTEGGLHPFEVIDGQHRLWAFEDAQFPDSFELPVVAFAGLDRSWQAYLFWSINIKPTRINASLAYDLYPLLRGEEWLERFSGPFVYRETRAQELVEAVWAHPLSPWRDRINMLGEPGSGQVSQAAWVRSLVATFVRAYEGARVKIGGLYGALPREHEPVVPWTRPQQAAFLIRAWAQLASAIDEQRPAWARELEARHNEIAPDDGTETPPLMFMSDSLLNTDQGVRAFLAVLNDLTVVRTDELDLESWKVDLVTDSGDFQDVSHALETLDTHKALTNHLTALGCEAATFDWRTANAPGIEGYEKTVRLTFRGAGGYRQLKFAVLHHLAGGEGPIAQAADTALGILDGGTAA